MKIWPGVQCQQGQKCQKCQQCQQCKKYKKCQQGQLKGGRSNSPTKSLSKCKHHPCVDTFYWFILHEGAFSAVLWRCIFWHRGLIPLRVKCSRQQRENTCFEALTENKDSVNNNTSHFRSFSLSAPYFSQWCPPRVTRSHFSNVNVTCVTKVALLVAATVSIHLKATACNKYHIASVPTSPGFGFSVSCIFQTWNGEWQVKVEEGGERESVVERVPMLCSWPPGATRLTFQ